MGRNRVMAFMALHDDPESIDFFVQIYDELRAFGLSDAEIRVVSDETSDLTQAEAVYQSHARLRAFMDRLMREHDRDKNSGLLRRRLQET